MINEKISFDYAIELTKEEFDRELSASPFIIREYIKHLMVARGKFIRAISLLACAEDNEGLISPNAVKLAVAIEILHLATLVHDDVMDNANKRRGMITLQKKYGKKTAVICGDYLLCSALKLAATVSDKQNYLTLDIPDYMSRICVGELNQYINNGNLDLSVYQYLKIISGKTAALFEACFYGGAILCEENMVEAKIYMRLGRYVGMLFQLNDDCLDFEATENIVKKPVRSDYEQGVITLPLIYAIKNNKQLKERAKAGDISIREISDAVFKAGGLAFARMVSQKYYNKSLTIIKELKITENKRQRLTEVLKKASGG